MDIEEDLKILQEFTELDRKLRNYKVASDYDNFCERRCVAIDHILAEREEDKKRIEELEAKLEFKQWGDLDNIRFEEYMKEFIPKQKIKDKIDEIIEDKDGKYYYEFLEFRDIQKTIDILSELLEEENK